MRIAILLVLTLFLSTSGISQTLDFSQVLSIKATPDTVPANKVWKVTSIVPALSHQTGSGPIKYTVIINGQTAEVGHSGWGSTPLSQNSAAYASSMTNSVFPIWLPAGTTLVASNGVLLISVIEFSVTP